MRAPPPSGHAGGAAERQPVWRVVLVVDARSARRGQPMTGDLAARRARQHESRPAARPRSEPTPADRSARAAPSTARHPPRSATASSPSGSPRSTTCAATWASVQPVVLLRQPEHRRLQRGAVRTRVDIRHERRHAASAPRSSHKPASGCDRSRPDPPSPRARSPRCRPLTAGPRHARRDRQPIVTTVPRRSAGYGPRSRTRDPRSTVRSLSVSA